MAGGEPVGWVLSSVRREHRTFLWNCVAVGGRLLPDSTEAAFCQLLVECLSCEWC